MTLSRFLALPLFAITAGMVFTPAAPAKSYLVKNQGGFEKAVKKAKPGDTIVLKSGTWKNTSFKLKASGQPGKPITVMPQAPGKVIITGQSNFKMGGEHLIVTGLMFKDGYTPSGEVVDFRADSATYCMNCRFVNNVIMDYNKPNGEKDFWVVLRGKKNKVDHNYFAGKTNEGPAMTIRLDGDQNIENNHLIARNFFGYRRDLGRNGGETIRVGTSSHMTKTSGTKIAQNYFEQTNGESEIISVKSRGNSILENTFFESEGSVVMRHGGETIVARNVFFGGGLPKAGGIRVINDNQIVRGNYLEGVGGTANRGALVVMNGVPNSPANRYAQVSHADITGNSFYDIKQIGLGTGANSELTLAPASTVIGNNVIMTGGRDPLDIRSSLSGISFTGNQTDFSNARTGISSTGVTVVRAANGLLYPVSGNAGAPRDINPVTRDNTGPKWFTKPAPVSAAKIAADVAAMKARR